MGNALSDDMQRILAGVGVRCTGGTEDDLRRALTVLGDPALRAEVAIELMRSRQVTPTKRAGEIVGLFEFVAALQDIAWGSLAAGEALVADQAPVAVTG